MNKERFNPKDFYALTWNELADTDFYLTEIIAYRVETNKGKTHHEPMRENHGFVFTQSGSFDYSSDGILILTAPENTLLYLPKHSKYTHCASVNSSTIVINFQVYDKTLNDLRLNSDIEKLKCKNIILLKQMFNELYNIYFNGSRLIQMKILLYDLLLLICNEQSYPINDKRYAMIEPAVNYLQYNLISKITVRELADMCFLSQNAFRNIFKEYYGIQPNQYLIKRRIDKACQMIAGTKLNINEIAMQLGFQDSANFTNMFKKYTGLSPSQFKSIK